MEYMWFALQAFAPLAENSATNQEVRVEISFSICNTAQMPTNSAKKKVDNNY